jgi:hypothetical protein
MRTWTDSTGKRKTKAALVRVEGDNGHFRLTDGKEVVMPLDKLCKADQAWIAKQAAGPPAEKTPREPRGPVRGSSRKPAGGLDRNGYLEEYLAYCMRINREAYLKVGKRNPAWDEAALKLLDAAARCEAYRDTSEHGWSFPVPSQDELFSLGAAARKAGCDDPLVFMHYLSTTARKSWNDEAIATGRQMLADMQQRGYPPLQVASMARLLSTGGRLLLEPHADALIEAACAKE